MSDEGMMPEEAEAFMDDTCTWTDDGDGAWFTECHNSFTVLAGTPASNGMLFCCYCGASLAEKREEPDADPGD